MQAVTIKAIGYISSLLGSSEVNVTMLDKFRVK